MIGFEQIFWAGWQYRWLFGIVLICLGVIMYKLRKQLQLASSLTSERLRPYMLPYFSSRRLVIKHILFSGMLIALFIAILRPQWNKKPEMIDQAGRDIYIAIDVSRSMLAKDIQPNRLEMAKLKIKKLLKQIPSERIGLIVFSGSAFVQCPLTTDYHSVMFFLDMLDVETISSGTTALDAALEKARRSFEQIPDRKNKLLFIFTDGEDFSTHLAPVTAKIRDAGIAVFSLGMATVHGAPVPLLDDTGAEVGHQQDERGEIVISRLNESVLEHLSADTGGMYVRITEDDKDIMQLAAHVEQVEKETFSQTEREQFQDQYQYFVGIGLLCLLVEWIL